MDQDSEPLSVELAADGSILTVGGEPSMSEDSASAESEDDITSPLSATRATIGATDWTIETIVQQMKRGRIDLNPKFQRRAAWTDQTKSKFIESAILNYPIPQIVLAEHKHRRGHFLVIDGKQRLLALRQFYAGSSEPDGGFEALRLTALTILSELKGSNVVEVQQKWPDLFDAFETHTIRTVVVRNWGVEDFLYTLFLRLNTGSIPLSPQELRQALVPGPFVDFVDAASGDSPGLRFLLGNRGPDRRMIDAEILVRFLGFYLSPVEYKGNLKLFLDDTCKAFNERWAVDEKDVRESMVQMEEAILAARRIFGDSAACHKWSGTQWERSFNRAVFDVQINALANREIRRLSLSNSELIRSKFMELCANDSDFSQAVSTTTKSLAATRTRFSKWSAALESALGASPTMPKCLQRDLTD